MGSSSQCPGQYQHLLFTTGEQPGRAVEESFEFREELEGSVDPTGAEVEVDAGGQLAEDRTFFADEAESAPGTAVEGSRQRPTLEIDPTGGREHPGDGQHRGGLAGTVGSEERDELAGGHLEIDAVDDGDVAVADGEAGDVEHQLGVPR